jgi:transaldolase
MPDATLEAFFDHGEVGAPLARDGGDFSAQLERFSQVGVDKVALALKLQDEGASSFATSWNELLSRIDSQLAGAKEKA